MMKLLSRIEKIEATLRESSAGAVLLREPETDADSASWERFAADAFAAQDSGQRIIVRASGAPDYRRIPGAEYYGDDFTALLALLALTPATDGRGNALRAAIAKAQGSSLPVIGRA